MRSAPLMWWTLLFVPLSFPPLLDKMVDDEATNEQDDEGHNTENLIPHPPAPSFSASWRLCLYFFCSWHHTTGCSCGVVLTWQGAGLLQSWESHEPFATALQKDEMSLIKTRLGYSSI
jgi:hypothetical protein